MKGVLQRDMIKRESCAKQSYAGDDNAPLSSLNSKEIYFINITALLFDLIISFGCSKERPCFFPPCSPCTRQRRPWPGPIFPMDCISDATASFLSSSAIIDSINILSLVVHSFSKILNALSSNISEETDFWK